MQKPDVPLPGAGKSRGCSGTLLCHGELEHRVISLHPSTRRHLVLPHCVSLLALGKVGGEILSNHISRAFGSRFHLFQLCQWLILERTMGIIGAVA